MVSLTCLAAGAGCLLGPKSYPSGMLNWASTQHEASQDCKMAKAEAARSLYLFIYLFLAALSLCCCAQAFSSCGESGIRFAQ